MIRPFCLALQTAAVAGSANGFRTSRAIPALVRVDSVFLDSSAADADVYAMIGCAAGDVTTLALAQNALQILDGSGQSDTTASRSVVALASGSMPIVGLGLILTAPLNRLFLGVINESASSVRVTALFQGVYLSDLEDFETDYLTRSEGANGTGKLQATGQAGSQGTTQFGALAGAAASQATAGAASLMGWAGALQAARDLPPEEAQRVLRELQRAAFTGRAVRRTPTPPPP